MKKMNNKGFSLVELIVVVLIMAIIAVALAPQVMKWVENSRKSNDIENYNALVEAANVAGTKESVLSAMKTTSSVTITMGDTNTQVSLPAFASAMRLTLPDMDSTAIQGQWPSGSTPFTIKVTFDPNGNGILVSKSAAPVKNFE